MESDRWLGVELRHLAALEAVAGEGSFGRAAARLGYTQSAVSQQIATLERIVGERLVDRPGGPRPVSLTEAGELLLGHAHGIVSRLKAAQADLAALSAGAAGSLRVGTYQSVGAKILPALLRSYGEEWPRVEIRLTESSDDENLLALVERGELDLAFSILPLPEGPFAAVELMRDAHLLLVPSSSPLADRTEPPTLEEIAALPLIGYRQCRSSHQVERHFQGTGFEPHVVFRSDDNGTVQGLVAAGVGCALVPRLSVDATPEVVAIDLAGTVPPRLIALAWHRDRYRTPASHAFVEAATEVCARLDALAPAA